MLYHSFRYAATKHDLTAPERLQVVMDSVPQGQVPHDMRDAIALYGVRSRDAAILLAPDILLGNRALDRLAMLKRPLRSVLDHLVRFHQTPNQDRRDALQRLDIIFPGSPDFDRRFRHLTPSAIVVAIFTDLDTAFFGAQLRHHIWLNVNAPLAREVTGRTDIDAHNRRERISIAVSMDLNHDRRRGYSHCVQEMLTILLHEMVHAFIAIYAWLDEFDEQPDHPRPDLVGDGHNLAFSKALGTVQMALDLAGWNIDLSEDGQYPLTMPGSYMRERGSRRARGEARYRDDSW